MRDRLARIYFAVLDMLGQLGCVVFYDQSDPYYEQILREMEQEEEMEQRLKVN
jgi:hypothetical protein